MNQTPAQLFPTRRFWQAIVYALLLTFALCMITFAAFGQATKPIGPMVWSQPVYSFDKWKARGIENLFRWEDEGGATSLDAFCAALKAKGLKVVLQDTGAKHWNDEVCIGVFLGNDEFNVPGPKYQSPATIAALKVEIRKTTAKDCYFSLNGGAVLSEDETELTAYCKSAEVLTFFHYPYNFGAGPGGVIQIGTIIDKLRRCAPGKPIVYIGECSNQGIGQQDWTKQNDSTGTPLSPKMHGPNPDEMAFEYGVAGAHGVDGIGYFPDRIGKWWEAFDGTTPECEAVMKNISRRYVSPAASTVVYLPSTQPAPTSQPAGYGNAYVHMRTYDGGRTWRTVVP